MAAGAPTIPAPQPSPPTPEPVELVQANPPTPVPDSQAHAEAPPPPPSTNDAAPLPPPKVPLSPPPATVPEGQVIHVPSSPSQRTVVTHQQLPNHEAELEPTTAEHLEHATGSAADNAQQKQPDTPRRELSSVHQSRHHVDVEIFATPSERRRQRSVSRVRSESSRRRSSSRPRSSHSTHIREFRDSYQSFYSDGSRRGEELDGTGSFVPPVPSLPREDGDISLYVEQRRKRRIPTQTQNPGPLIRLVPGVAPGPSGNLIDRPLGLPDPHNGFASNTESPTQNVARADEVEVKKCSRREKREQEERMRREDEERMRWEKEDRLRWEREHEHSFQDGRVVASDNRAKVLGQPTGVNITITRTTTVRRKPRTPGSSSSSSPSTSQPDCLPHLPSESTDYSNHRSLELARNFRKQPKPKLGFAYVEDGPLPVTYREHRDMLSAHIVEKGLEAIIPTDSIDAIEIARSAEAEADRICALLGISPYGTPDLTKIGLYDIIVFCDDSGSMLQDTRFEDQKSVVQRVSRIARTYNRSGLSLRFINFEDDENYNHLSQDEINGVMSKVFPSGSTKLGTKLLEKVLFPFVLNPARRMALNKPVLISIITDGEPTDENVDTLKHAILACKSELGKCVNSRGLPYGRSAVTFQINRIGNSPESKRFMDRLSNDPEIANLIFCNDETLDAAVRKAGPDSGALNTWLTQLLAGAVKMY